MKTVIQEGHEWEVTDSQGYEMQCTKCTLFIVHGTVEWDLNIDATCPKKEVKP